MFSVPLPLQAGPAWALAGALLVQARRTGLRLDALSYTRAIQAFGSAGAEPRTVRDVDSLLMSLELKGGSGNTRKSDLKGLRFCGLALVLELVFWWLFLALLHAQRVFA